MKSILRIMYLFTICLLPFIFTKSVIADKIYLKNGKVYEGEIELKTKKFIRIIKNDGGLHSFGLNMVDHYERTIPMSPRQEEIVEMVFDMKTSSEDFRRKLLERNKTDIQMDMLKEAFLIFMDKKYRPTHMTLEVVDYIFDIDDKFDKDFWIDVLRKEDSRGPAVRIMHKIIDKYNFIDFNEKDLEIILKNIISGEQLGHYTNKYGPPMEELRKVVFNKLGKKAIPPLFYLLKDSKSASFVYDALFKFVELDNKTEMYKQWIPFLKEVVNSKETDSISRKELFTSKIGAMKILVAIGDISLSSFFIEKIIDETTPDMNKYAAEGLLKTGCSKEDVQILRGYLNSTKLKFSKIQICRVLAELGGKAIIPDLIKVANDKGLYDEIRTEAIHGLGRMKSNEAVQHLISMIEDRYEIGFVQRACVDALGMIGDSRALPCLVNILMYDEDRFSRQYAAKSIGELGDKSAIKYLEQAIKREETSLNNKFCDFIGKSIIVNNQPASSGKNEVIANIYGALIQLGENRYLQPLKDLAASEDYCTQREANLVLERLEKVIGK